MPSHTNRLRIFLGCMLLGLAGLLFQGCESNKIEGPLHLVDFYMEASPNLPARFIQGVELPISGVQVTVASRPFLNSWSVQRVELVQVDLGLAMMFQFDRAGMVELYQQSLNNVGRRIIVTVNGEPLGVRVIDTAIQNGVLMCFFELEDEDMNEMAIKLKDTTEHLIAKKNKTSPIGSRNKRKAKEAEEAQGK